MVFSTMLFITGLTDAGTITGEITYTGNPPARQALKATKDQHCMNAMKSTRSESLVVSQGKGIKNAVVYLRRVRGAEAKPPAQNPVMDQVGCMYHPHVLAVVMGSTVDVKSADPVAHNVHSHAKDNAAAAINWQIPQPGKALPLKGLDKPEAIQFTCDIHNWMSGYIVVVENNYFAVTGYKDTAGKWISADDYEKSSDKGTYAIKDVPAGKYRMQAWHEELGIANATVDVPASGDVKINFTSDQFKKGAAE
jgi:plastocyanin